MKVTDQVPEVEVDTKALLPLTVTVEPLPVQPEASPMMAIVPAP